MAGMNYHEEDVLSKTSAALRQICVEWLILESEVGGD